MPENIPLGGVYGRNVTFLGPLALYDAGVTFSSDFGLDPRTVAFAPALRNALPEPARSVALDPVRSGLPDEPLQALDASESRSTKFSDDVASAAYAPAVPTSATEPRTSDAPIQFGQCFLRMFRAIRLL
jgi:hypothetical protein